MVEVVVRGVRGEDPAVETLRSAGLRLRLLACRPTDRGRQRLLRLFEVEGASENLPSALRRLHSRLGLREVTTTQLGPGRALLRVAVPLPPTCAAAFELGDFCVSCPFLDGDRGTGSANWSVLVPRIGDARQLLRSAASADGARPSLVRAGAYRRAGGLTSRQERALQVAYQLGYFDYPRKVSLSAVASRLGVGRSAALELLRKGMTKLTAQRFVTESTLELSV